MKQIFTVTDADTGRPIGSFTSLKAATDSARWMTQDVWEDEYGEEAHCHRFVKTEGAATCIGFEDEEGDRVVAKIYNSLLKGELS